MGLDVPARRRGGCGGLWCYELRYGSGTRIDAFGLWGASVRVKGRDRLCGRVCERGGIAVGRSGDDMGLAAYLTSEEEGPMHDLLLRVAEVAPRLRPGLPSERRNEMFP